MIQQLVIRLGGPPPAAAAVVLQADPFDLALHMEEVWSAANPALGPGPGRQLFLQAGAFTPFAPPPGAPAWDHLGYSYVLENTRAVQVLRRVVREYRGGERLGVPSIATQRWLDATEVLLFGGANPITPWLSTSTLRQDPEAVRRNAYWRLFGLNLAFGADDNRPAVYDRAEAANTSFVVLFEELLFELWQAITNLNNLVGVDTSDDDRIFRIAQQLSFILTSRRQRQTLAREELAAATALGWAELTLSMNSPVVVDLKSEATSAADRLQLIGERVGLPAHSKCSSFFAMSTALSRFLRTIESGVVAGPGLAGLLYNPAPPAIGADSRRVITEWAAARGKDLKSRAKPVETATRRQLASARQPAIAMQPQR